MSLGPQALRVSPLGRKVTPYSGAQVGPCSQIQSWPLGPAQA